MQKTLTLHYQQQPIKSEGKGEGETKELLSENAGKKI
jgi:hypothetical protein